MVDRCVDTPVPDRLGHDRFDVLDGPLEAELEPHVSQADARVGQIDAPQPGADDVVPQAHDQVARLVRLEDRAVLLGGVVEELQVADAHRLREESERLITSGPLEWIQRGLRGPNT